MAVNLAKKYAAKVDERFQLGALTALAVNNDYEWTGVSAVEVYSIPTVAMGDYARTGTNRYGTPSELQDTVQEMLLSRDRSFTFTIDKGNQMEQMDSKDAGKALRRQIDEVVLPEIDTYRLGKMAAKKGGGAVTTVTADNAYSLFLAGNGTLDDAKVPAAGRVCFCGVSFYNYLKQDSSFVKASDMGQAMLSKGVLGEVDGVAIVKVPSSYLPTGVAFIITHKVACCAPQKLQDYITHKNPPGLNGKRQIAA